jgi:gliding motility associated protien GldN
MKKRFLIVILCLLCTVAFSQTTKKKGKKKRTTTTQGVKKKKKKSKIAAVAIPPTPEQAPVPPTPVIPVDTTKKVVVEVPKKPFIRPLDGYIEKSNILNSKLKPYPYIREADVAYSKRIWREIDLREKLNQYLNSPKARLIDVILEAVEAGELTAYDPTSDSKLDVDGDSFAHPFPTPDKARSSLIDSSFSDVFDKDGNKTGSILKANVPDPDSLCYKFRIKEDWIFDKQRSVFEPRIVGIAAMKKVKIDGLVANDFQPAFWIYFKEARPIFVTKEVASKGSDASGLSFDDVFVKRLFTSYIIKESNEKNERIKDYKTGIDKLYESERIKKALMDWELNLWQY